MPKCLNLRCWAVPCKTFRWEMSSSWKLTEEIKPSEHPSLIVKCATQKGRIMIRKVSVPK